MHHRSFAKYIASGIITVGSLAAAPDLHGQAQFPADSIPLSGRPTALLSALSRYRSIRWASSARAIRCAPAPLTEWPGVETEFARPHVAPLEEAFADALSVKRAVAVRSRSMAMESRE